jgi:hypothetical protein
MLICMDMESGIRSYGEPAAEMACTAETESLPARLREQLALRLELVQPESRRDMSARTQAFVAAGYDFN